MRVKYGGAGDLARRDRDSVGQESTAAAFAPVRYSSPLRSTRFRPGWHKILGGLVLVSALAVAIVNELQLTLLPGSHNELYLVLSAGLAGLGTWWLGWFDDGRPFE